MRDGRRGPLTHPPVFTVVMSKGAISSSSYGVDGAFTVQETVETGEGLDVRRAPAMFLPRDRFRHYFAALPNFAACPQPMARKYKGPCNLLIGHDVCGFFGGARPSISHCGTLTYRQKRLAKRQPYPQIAAAQQIQVRNGDCRGGSNRNKPVGPLTQSGHGERRVEASLNDVLGFGVVIGLIRFVRSASIRG